MEATENAKSDTETESTEEEIEPKFKYKRIGNDLKTILNTDVVTCSAVHPKFLIFGTFLGRVYLLDHQGNSVASNLRNDGQHSEFAHTVAVNTVDVDYRGEHVATCSDDGKVNITGLFTNENNQNLRFGKKIKAVALDPDVKSLQTGKRFIVGDDKLTMYEKTTFLKKLKAQELSSAEGGVLSVCWSGAFVAWASHLGVRVYDLNEKCSLGLMKWEEPPNARLENFRCNFRWSDATTLLIGWVDTIRICVIRKRNAIEASTRDLPGLIVDPISTFQTTFYISGLAPLSNNPLNSKQLVVLGYPKEKDADHKSLRPVLCIIEYKLNSSVEICSDSLSLRGYAEYAVNDYSLCCIMEENRYFIVAPKDIVVATLYDTDDHVKWLIEHQKYKEAIDVLSMQGGDLIPVAKLHINHLLSLKEFEEAGKECLRLFGNDCALWKEEVYKFFKYNQLRAVSAYLPTAEDRKLEPQVYEMVLYEYLRHDAAGFLNLIKEWPPYLYDCSAVINAITGKFRKQDANELLEALAHLYLYQEDYENALRIFLKLQNKDVFELIYRYQLYGIIPKMIIQLIELDRESAFKILLDRNKISPQIVVQQLEQNQEYLYWYLDALERVDSSGTFHWKLLNLYARFAPAQLLPFLRHSRHYPIQEALDICKRNFFYSEMVYLLGQMGSTTEALDIIIDKLKDIEMAIEFCKQHNDTDLWNILILESNKKPQIMTKLLDGIAGYMDPVEVINKIKPGQKIPGLRKSLVKMLWDYRLQLEIQQSSYQLQTVDCFNTHADVVRQQQRGHLVSFDLCCEHCRLAILSKDSTLPGRNDVIVFGCGHAYHDKCLPSDKCGVCAAHDDDDNE